MDYLINSCVSRIGQQLFGLIYTALASYGKIGKSQKIELSITLQLKTKTKKQKKI